MWNWFLVSLSIYVLTILVIHVLNRWNFIRRKASIQYIIFTDNSQKTIEWVIRSLQFVSWLKGTPYRITVIDVCSEDDTRLIVERLSLQAAVRWTSVSSSAFADRLYKRMIHVIPEERDIEVIDLRQKEKLGDWSISQSGKS